MIYSWIHRSTPCEQSNGRQMQFHGCVTSTYYLSRMNISRIYWTSSLQRRVRRHVMYTICYKHLCRWLRSHHIHSSSHRRVVVINIFCIREPRWIRTVFDVICRTNVLRRDLLIGVRWLLFIHWSSFAVYTFMSLSRLDGKVSTCFDVIDWRNKKENLHADDVISLNGIRMYEPLCHNCSFLSVLGGTSNSLSYWIYVCLRNTLFWDYLLHVN